jgi:anthranilate synthase component 1
MDMCIALRTLVLQDGRAYIQAGCGVVYDSIPSAEYEETVNKARGMVKAVEMADDLTA